jgi:hypothetical protein
VVSGLEVFFSDRGGRLRRMPSHGGPVQELTSGLAGVGALQVSPRWVSFRTSGGVHRLVRPAGSLVEKPRPTVEQPKPPDG